MTPRIVDAVAWRGKRRTTEGIARKTTGGVGHALDLVPL